MNVKLAPGHYIVAVSGGVDSVALLHMLQNKPGLSLTVAHYDHGIRQDSKKDRLHVQQLAKNYGLPFVYHEGQLGPGASEATARDARYEFLRSAQKVAKARAIITAHHQDDVLETAIHNILRGTGRKGLSSMANSVDIVRPLTRVSKTDLINYAQKNGLVWREDSTNQDVRYRRNYIRHKIIPKIPTAQRQELMRHINKMTGLNRNIDDSITSYLHQQPASNKLDRYGFIMLPHKVSLEIMAGWLRNHGIREFDKPLLERLVTKSKVLGVAKTIDINGLYLINVNNDTLALKRRDR